MSYSSVVLEPAVSAAIVAEMRRAKGTETGGVLVGYTRECELIACAASGPGPRAELSRHKVMVDGEFAAKFCQQMFERTDGRCDYIGDWHCHLSCLVIPSELDHNAMRIMAEFPSSPTRHPVSVIRAKWSGRTKAYRYDERLVRVPLIVDE